MSKPKSATEAQAKLELVISEKFPDLPPGGVKQVAKELAGYSTGNAVAQFQDRAKIAEDWHIAFEALKEIDAQFKDEYKNMRKAASQRLQVLVMGLTDSLKAKLSDPDVIAETSPQDLGKTLKYLVDSMVTLDEGHPKPTGGADLASLAGIRALLGNPNFISEMKRVNGKEISKP